MPPSPWVQVSEDSPFPLSSLPYGAASPPGRPGQVVVAIGDMALAAGDAARAVGSSATKLLCSPLLNPLMAAGPPTWQAVRAELTSWLGEARFEAAVRPHLYPLESLSLRLPFAVGDYVDFYSSEHHAVNAGAILRPGSDPLPKNWRYLPIGYHGRAGTVAVSGTPVRRPSGQILPDGGGAPVFAPTAKLDLEAELGFVVGVPSPAGQRVAVRDFPRHVFGVTLLNDWSARDIQAWEYIPLGPFLAKSFLTSVSAWVVPLEALEAARIEPPARPVRPFPHLDDTGLRWGLDITLEVELNGHVLTRPPFSLMYWTAAQQLAHLTSNGASLRTGDLFGSGTVSGPGRDQVGSLLELSRGGSEPFRTPDEVEHTYLRDGDQVVLRASAPAKGGGRLGFGEVRARVLGAHRVDPDGGAR